MGWGIGGGRAGLCQKRKLECQTPSKNNGSFCRDTYNGNAFIPSVLAVLAVAGIDD